MEAIRGVTNFSAPYDVGPTGNETEFFNNIFENAGAKAELGFPVSVADTFGQFWATWLPQNSTYLNYSDLAANGSSLAEGAGPMPIITLAEVVPGQSPEIGKIMYPGRNDTNGFNLTSYEVTPFEFGSWVGGRVQGFIPTQWLGTSMDNGTAQNSSQCVAGFDKFSLVQGSTTNAFCAWFIDDFYGRPIFAKRSIHNRQQGSNETDDIPIPQGQEQSPLVQIVNETASNFQQTFNESMWATYPNPFQGYNDAMGNTSELLLVSYTLDLCCRRGLTQTMNRWTGVSQARTIRFGRSSSLTVKWTLLSFTRHPRRARIRGSMAPAYRVSTYQARLPQPYNLLTMENRYRAFSFRGRHSIP